MSTVELRKLQAQCLDAWHLVWHILHDFCRWQNEVLVVLQVGHRFANRCTWSCFFLVFTWLFCHSSLDVADPGSQDWWCIPCISKPIQLIESRHGTAYTWTKCLQIKQLHVSPHHSNPLILKTSVVSKKILCFNLLSIYILSLRFLKKHARITAQQQRMLTCACITCAEKKSCGWSPKLEFSYHFFWRRNSHTRKKIESFFEKRRFRNISGLAGSYLYMGYFRVIIHLLTIYRRPRTLKKVGPEPIRYKYEGMRTPK